MTNVVSIHTKPAPSMYLHVGDPLPVTEGATSVTYELFSCSSYGQVKFTVQNTPVVGTLLQIDQRITHMMGPESTVHQPWTVERLALLNLGSPQNALLALMGFGVEDGRIVDSENVTWGDVGNQDSFADVVWGIVGFCSCGSPEAALAFVDDALSLVGGRGGETYRAQRRAIETKHSVGALYFFWYWLEKQDYEEHGGSTPGWLTYDGELFRLLVRQARTGSMCLTETTTPCL